MVVQPVVLISRRAAIPEGTRGARWRAARPYGAHYIYPSLDTTRQPTATDGNCTLVKIRASDIPHIYPLGDNARAY